MRQYFEDLASFIDTLARPSEIIISRFSAEDSEFLRLNKSAVRQATAVKQFTWALSLIEGTRRIDASVSLSGQLDADREQLKGLIETLRMGIADVPEDPFLLIQTEPATSVGERPGKAPPALHGLDAYAGCAAARLRLHSVRWRIDAGEGTRVG